MTARGVALLVAAVLLWVLGRFLGVAELSVVALAGAALVVLGVVVVRAAGATVSVRRHTSAPRLLSGATGEVGIELRNDARLPAAVLLVEDRCHHALAEEPRWVVPGIPPGRRVALRYAIAGGARGRYEVGPVTVRVRDPFGVAERQRRYTGTDEVLVWPRIERLSTGVVRGGHRSSGTSATRRLFSAGDELYTMREYVQGDDLRQVHWPSTAHRGVLMVRQPEQPWEARATVLLDTRAIAHAGAGQAGSFEVAVSAAASIVWHLADLGYWLRLTTDADPRVPALTAWEQALDRLAEVQPTRDDAWIGALRRLRTAGAGEGLLVAVVTPPRAASKPRIPNLAAAPAAPADSEPPAVGALPEIKALVAAGRAYATRIAVVVDARTAGAVPADLAAAALKAAGWRTIVVGPGRPLANGWAGLAHGRHRPPVAATGSVS